MKTLINTILLLSLFPALSKAAISSGQLTGVWINQAGRIIELKNDGTFSSTDIHFGDNPGEWNLSERDGSYYLLLTYSGGTFDASYFGEIVTEDDGLVYRILLYTETEAWCNGKIDWELYSEWDAMDYYQE